MFFFLDFVITHMGNLAECDIERKSFISNCKKVGLKVEHQDCTVSH